MVRRYTRAGAPHLHVHTKRVWVEQADGTEIDLMDVCLKRSKLLRNICDTVVPPWEAQLEIDAAGLQQWLLHVQPDHVSPAESNATKSSPSRKRSAPPVTPHVQAGVDGGPSPGQKRPKMGKQKAGKAAAAAGGDAKHARPSESCKRRRAENPTSRERACRFSVLLKAADALADERTGAEACAGLAAELEAEADLVLASQHHRKPLIAAKVLAGMSEDLVLKALRAMHRPLSALLHYLYTTPFSPHLLRTFHPSIDTNASLRLGPMLDPDAAFLLRPLATLTHLQSLSLAGTPLVHMHAPNRVDPITDLGSALCALPALSALCLRDAALRAAAPALATALPTLKHLRTLDASGNRLDGAFAALAAALPAALALRTLLLDGAAATAPTLRALAAALWKMPHLEELSIGTPCRMPHACEVNAEQLDPPFEYTTTASLLYEVLAPLRSMAALQSLTLTYKLPPDTALAVAPALVSLSQLRHLALHSLDLCNLPDQTASDSQRNMCMWELQRAMELSPQWSPVAPGAGLFFLSGLTSLDLSHAAGVPSSEIDMASLTCSLTALTQLQRLRLPRSGLVTFECTDIIDVMHELTAVTMVEVRAAAYSRRLGVGEMASSLAGVPHLRHIRVPLILECWNGGDGARGTHCLHAEAAAALAAAAAEKVVEVDLQCYEHGVAAANAEAAAAASTALRPVLPLCGSLRVGGRSGVHLQVIASAVVGMTALTQLRLEVDGDEWSDGGLETGHQRLMQGLGLLTRLQSLSFASSMPGARDASRVFCDQLTCLRQLTNLEVAVRGVDHEMVPQVISACRSLPCLCRLELRLLEAQPQRCDGRVVDEPAWWTEALAPEGWDLGALTSLQTLLVFNHGNLEGDEPFWEGLFRLSRLQSLHLHDYIDSWHGHMLQNRLFDFFGMALQELHVDRDPQVLDSVQARIMRHEAGVRVAFQRD